MPLKIDENIKKVLIIGMAGGLAKILSGIINRKHPHIEIIGVDSRKIESDVKRDNIKHIQMKYTRGNFEKIFREHNFDIVFHLARLSHASALPSASLAQRLDLNLMGTKRILDLALDYQVKKIVVLSTFHVYGALRDNPTFISEDSPLRASIKYPELRDVVEMDQLATNWLWKNQQDIRTIVLRPCNIIGPQINNTMSQYLTTPYAPIPVDFNPMFQFVHEFDMANILFKSIEQLPTGIYNDAPDETISLKQARKQIGKKSLPVPIFFFEQILKSVNNPLWKFPNYLIDYIKFSCIIDNANLNKYINDPFRYSIRESLELIKIN